MTLITAAQSEALKLVKDWAYIVSLNGRSYDPVDLSRAEQCGDAEYKDRLSRALYVAKTMWYWNTRDILRHVYAEGNGLETYRLRRAVVPSRRGWPSKPESKLDALLRHALDEQYMEVHESVAVKDCHKRFMRELAARWERDPLQPVDWHVVENDEIPPPLPKTLSLRDGYAERRRA